jgi:CRISPR-associated endonuclease/helicase Cas3
VNEISLTRFAEFFQALHGRCPYSWQSRLAARAIDGHWPGIIDVPTGSGKTACIDIAIFACACQAQRAPKDRTAPRRIFFCVNRRVIVDEAYQRAKLIARKLDEADRIARTAPAILGDVAEALRAVAGSEPGDDAPPLDAIELRGGIYRDNRWARSAQQPTVICTTIDQLGSRLLFRGYGVSSSAAPIQAALVAYDSLVLLDEAHISTPFRQTLEGVRRYMVGKQPATHSIEVPPMVFVPLSATPSGGDVTDAIRLDDDDRNNEALARRLAARKPATLHRVSDVPRAIVDYATRIVRLAGPPAAIGIIVNRVASAKDIYRRLRSSLADAAVELVIGSMRPIDRDEQSKRVGNDVGPGRSDVARRLSIIVATQCLECGADYDFDVLITECASLDALRQRFGRLNRGGRPIAARGAVFVKDKDAKPVEALSDDDPLDPIYGNALARTWHWLWNHATTQTAPDAAEPAPKRAKSAPKPAAESREVDFGIDAFSTLLGESGRIPDELLAPSASLPAPVMLPSHLDFWCQTSSPPVPEPDVALFIHGPQRGEPDVQVCWRGDLVEDEHLTRRDWGDVVSMLPPTAPECMSVPISRVRRWLAQPSDRIPDLGDLLDVAAIDEIEPNGDGADVEQDLGIVLWRGVGKSKLLASPGELRPGDTLVVPLNREGWNELGHIPEPAPEQGGKGEPPPDQPATVVGGTPIDVAEAAFLAVRDRAVLRLYPSLFQSRRNDGAVKDLLKVIAESDGLPSVGELRDLLRSASDALPETHESLREKLADFAKNTFARVAYPDGRGVVITARKPSGSQTWGMLMPIDDGEDDASRIGGTHPVSLADHTRHVQKALALALQAVPTAVSNEVFDSAAERHDWGKADERFQAWLRDTGRTDNWLFAGAAPTLLAKSGRPPSITERKAARQRAGLPDGFRHEMLSVQLAESAAIVATLVPERDLILHLIAAHHGYARPFAPAAVDDDPPDVAVYGVGLSAHLRREMPPHRLDSGIADRFWSLTRRFGWWGLAYLEALLRLADQRASAREDAGGRDDHDTSGNSESRS